ncbi:MAG: ferric reductase-like transmembrane domain-containing protein [Actinomycetota bacterium]|nr:ferric reductase-like transmembrane domain-containing protein [Actinomycetota bacterium]
MSSTLVWYTARASGIVAWTLAAASVLWGLAISTRAMGSRPRPAWLFDLHRFLGGIAVVFTGVHVGAILLDTYVQFSLVNVLVPFTGNWHPAAVAWGIAAMYVLLAVEITSLARSRIPKRLWRRVHYGGFVVFAAGTVHALSAGTDAGSTWFRILVMGVVLAAATLTAVRVMQWGRRQPVAAVDRRRAATS